MGNGLAALMGVLSGSGGLSEGMIAADKTRLADEQLAEAKRHTQVLEGQLNTPIGSLYDTLGLATPSGVDPSKSVPTSLLPHAYGAIEKEQARQATEARRGILDQALGRAATDFGTPAIDRSAPGMSDPEAAGTPAPTTMKPHPGISLLRQVIPGLDPEKVTPAVTELIKELNPGGGKYTHSIASGAEGPVAVRFDQKANVAGITPLNIGRPEGHSAQIDTQRKRLAAEYRVGTFPYAPESPQFEIELGKRVENMVPVGPDSELWRKSNVPGGLTPPSAGQPSAKRPPTAGHPEIKEAGQRQSIITQLLDTADAADQMSQLKDAQGRGSLRVRSWIQGHTPFEQLTPEEQDYVTTHDNLRIFYEQARMGLGPFRSPEMQRQLAEIIGAYWTPGTGVRLRTLARALYEEQQGIGAMEQAGGRRSISAPTGPPPPRPGQTGRQVRIRDPKTGRTGVVTLGPGEQIPAGLEAIQ